MSLSLDRLALALALALSLSLAACGGGGAAKEANAPSSSSAAPGSPLADQLARGAKIYDDACGSCHGDKGKGDGSVPAVAGQGALPEAPPSSARLRKGKFVNAQDVFDFTKREMPKGALGSVPEADLWAVTAWELANVGADLGTTPLDATRAKDVKVRK